MASPEQSDTSETAARTIEQVDVCIVGGGIAGLWLLNLLNRKGYNAILFEADRLGGQQTLASQGMIHGGLKYALGGVLTGASEAIARMPDRWRACLDGQGEVDLSGLEPLSDQYYLFAAGNSLGKLTGFFASRLLRGRIAHLARAQFPAALADFDGVVYALNDFVLDTPALLERLLNPIAHRVYQQRMAATCLVKSDSGWTCRLPDDEVDDKVVTAKQLVITAGAGSAELLAGFDIQDPQMQLRPLHQVIVRHPDLQPLYAHCLTGVTRAEPRLTITSHPDPEQPGRWLWYLGGQLATSGVHRDTTAQIKHARAELHHCAPWIDWQSAELSTLRCDRAEPRQSGGRRPDEAFVARISKTGWVCWPTKLSLVPDLGDQILDQLEPPASAERSTSVRRLDLPVAELGRLPWATGQASSTVQAD